MSASLFKTSTIYMDFSSGKKNLDEKGFNQHVLRLRVTHQKSQDRITLQCGLCSKQNFSQSKQPDRVANLNSGPGRA